MTSKTVTRLRSTPTDGWPVLTGGAAGLGGGPGAMSEPARSPGAASFGLSSDGAAVTPPTEIDGGPGCAVASPVCVVGGTLDGAPTCAGAAAGALAAAGTAASRGARGPWSGVAGGTGCGAGNATAPGSP